MTTVDPARAEKSGSRADGAGGRVRVPGPRRPEETDADASTRGPDGADTVGGTETPAGADAPDGRGQDTRPAPGWRGRIRSVIFHPVPAALILAALLHLLWVVLLANSGGDLAAQDAWAEFALQHPDLAYNLSWYGGMHPVSYSVISPHLMAALGVRTTMMIAGTISAGLLALLVIRSRAVTRPMPVALYGTFALICNAISGRVTFGLGAMFGLGALAVIFAWPTKWRSHQWSHKAARASLAALLSALATMSSPVAGLFVGVVAAALWLTKRRPAAYALGVTPVIVVGLSAWLFPFSGTQPMSIGSAILPVVAAVGAFLCPKEWRTVRVGAVLYGIGTILTWLIPSQIGTNITRLGMIFGGVVMLAALTTYRRPAREEVRTTPYGRKWLALVLALTTITIWQLVKTGDDIIHARPDAAWNRELAPLVDQLKRVEADRGRVEVVPVRSHRESSALAPYVNLARGWNRQADKERNPLFYEDEDRPLDPDAYRAWLNRWAVHYVVLPKDEPDHAAKQEAELITGGLPYLREVWSDGNWKLYKVSEPTPIADPPATVVRAGADQLELTVESEGPVLIRIPYTRWLALVDADGDGLKAPSSGKHGGPPVNRNGCLTNQVQKAADGEPEDEWTVLHAPHPGTYRIAAPYQIPPGTPCPDDMVE
ncbi:MFS transporter [Streptomyces sp. XD-27]|uniref:MFS transporter n=1 Tax=Streptomyces sp. XD-27 TaxID=3062779 RepID=UPI0026F44423|nr:MFS transporter [Streptomyces sp. XD-27]WKX72126.1 MFS transporter [Streptomyces sp. XD-27]